MKPIPDNPHRNHNDDVMLIEKLEANYQEAIKALKNSVDFEIYVAIQDQCSDEQTERIIHKNSIAIIEKAYGKSWEELSE